MSSGTLARPTAGHDVPTSRIAALAAPLVLSTLAVLGAQLVVTALMGRVGDAALYVRAVYTPVAFLFVAVTTGLGVTVQVAAARAAGAGRTERVAPSLGGAARIGTALCAFVAAALWLGSGALADLVGVADARRGEFTGFLVAMAVVSVAGLLGELCASALRGIGRTGRAAALTGTHVVLTVGIVAVAGVGLGGGLVSVPAAALVAGAVELAAGLVLLRRAGLVSWQGLTSWLPETPRLALAIGLPVAGSYLLLFVVNFLLLRVVAPLGEAAVSGFALGWTVQTVVIVPAVGVGSAIAILMNQQLAGGSRAAIARTFHRGLALVAGAYAVVTVVLLAVGKPLVEQLSANPDVVAHTWRFVAVVGPTFGCTGLVLAALTVLEQIGHGPFAVAMHIVYFAAVVAVGWSLVARSGDIGDLYLTMAVAAAVSLVTGVASAWWVVRRTASRLEPS